MIMRRWTNEMEESYYANRLVKVQKNSKGKIYLFTYVSFIYNFSKLKNNKINDKMNQLNTKDIHK